MGKMELMFCTLLILGLGLSLDGVHINFVGTLIRRGCEDELRALSLKALLLVLAALFLTDLVDTDYS
jgi:hypothetical protein